jgi:hypothetical protein
MHRSSRLASAAATASAPQSPRLMLTRGPPGVTGRAPTGNGTAVSADLARYLAQEHDRIAQGINNVVIRRIFAAGLDLQAALAIIGDHRGASKINHAIGELDQAIRDIRDTIFSADPGEPR